MPSPTHDPTEALARIRFERVNTVRWDEVRGSMQHHAAQFLIEAKDDLAALSAAGWHLTRAGDEELRTALEGIARMHSPVDGGGMGWLPDGGYGGIDPACQVCGTDDEYAVPWPCPTRQQADAALDSDR